jgi:hypothetical protein
MALIVCMKYSFISVHLCTLREAYERVYIRVRFFLYRTQLQTAIYIIQNIHNSPKLDDSSNRPVGILNLWTP